MKEIPKDTIICYYIGRCKNHPIKKDIRVDTMVNATNITNADTAHQLVLDTNHIHQVAIKPIKPVHPIKTNHIAVDTIEDNVVSLIQDTTYETQSQSVRFEPINNVPMTYDVPVNGLVMGFTIYLTIKYAVNCLPHWTNLISDLKQELSKV